MGAGQEKANFTTEMRIVLRSTYQNSESCRNQKLENSGFDQGLPNAPSEALKSRNASVMP